MSERGPLAIVEGRHPLMEQLQGSDEFVPNDTYLAGESYATLLTLELMYTHAASSGAVCHGFWEPGFAAAC